MTGKDLQSVDGESNTSLLTRKDKWNYLESNRKPDVFQTSVQTTTP